MGVDRVAGLELKVPPVVVVLICAALMWLLSVGTPGVVLSVPFRRSVSACVALAGVASSMLGVVAFHRARTTVNPIKPTLSSALVVSGIYRRSRNPMYLGFLLILLGWALWLGNVLAFAFLAVFIAYMNSFQIGPEERALREIFGDDFKIYCSQVRRWI